MAVVRAGGALGTLASVLADAFAKIRGRWQLQVWFPARIFPGKVCSLLAARVAAGSHRALTEEELLATRWSDTVYIFGSGASLNEIPAEEFAAFERAQTMGFNWFVHSTFVRVDFHLLREVAEYDWHPLRWRRELSHYGALVRGNPCYAETIFLVQGGFRALNGNRVLARRDLGRGRRVFRWTTATGRERLGTSFADGLSHAGGTLDECVNAAVLMGFRRIVLVGVDLYDRRYFWLGAEETLPSDRNRGATFAMAHATVSERTIERYGRWHAELAGRGVSLEVYNPRSLLAAVLPVAEPAMMAP